MFQKFWGYKFNMIKFKNLPSSMTSTLLLGLVFHLCYIASVFDCYFTSPVVHGMRHFNTGAASAKRLVLIVGETTYKLRVKYPVSCVTTFLTPTQGMDYVRIYCLI